MKIICRFIWLFLKIANYIKCISLKTISKNCDNHIKTYTFSKWLNHKFLLSLKMCVIFLAIFECIHVFGFIVLTFWHRCRCHFQRWCLWFWILEHTAVSKHRDNKAENMHTSQNQQGNLTIQKRFNLFIMFMILFIDVYVAIKRFKELLFKKKYMFNMNLLLDSKTEEPFKQYFIQILYVLSKIFYQKCMKGSVQIKKYTVK